MNSLDKITNRVLNLVTWVQNIFTYILIFLDNFCLLKTKSIKLSRMRFYEDILSIKLWTHDYNTKTWKVLNKFDVCGHFIGLLLYTDKTNENNKFLRILNFTATKLIYVSNLIYLQLSHKLALEKTNTERNGPIAIFIFLKVLNTKNGTPRTVYTTTWIGLGIMINHTKNYGNRSKHMTVTVKETD